MVLALGDIELVGHASHVADPVLDLYVPALHGKQTFADPVYPALHRQAVFPEDARVLSGHV